jgi:hypothetical protein
MGRRLEEIARHNASFELIAQRRHKFGSIARFEARKDGRSETTGRAVKLWVGSEKVIDQDTVGIQQGSSAIANTIKVI